MVAAVRTREDVLQDLATLTVQARRMPVHFPGYEPIHDAINDRLDELDGFGADD